MKKIIVLLISAFLISGCVERKTIRMNMNELINDAEKEVYNESLYYYYGYKSLEEGDILIIEDNISGKMSQENVTFISFVSSPEYGIYFDSNLTDLKEGDHVEIKLHIKKDNFKKAINSSIWTYELEVFEEGWDFEQHTPIPISASSIKRI
ncbi:MAG: hypothetical protein QXF32_03425 [Candidatus Thermoplasmatota archaeon]